MREVEYMTAPEDMEGVEIVLTGGLVVVVQVTQGVDQVLIMGGIAALSMIGTVVLHLAGPGVLNMGDTEGRHIFSI